MEKGSSTVVTSSQETTSTTPKNPYWIIGRGVCDKHDEHKACIVIKLDDQPRQGQNDLVFRFVGSSATGIGKQAIQVLQDLIINVGEVLAECEHYTDPVGFSITEAGKLLHVHYDTDYHRVLVDASNRLKGRLDRVVSERRLQYWRDPRTGYFHPHHQTLAQVNQSWDL